MFLRNIKKNKGLLILLFSLIGFSLIGQNKKNSYEKEKKELLKKIQHTNKVLSQTRALKKTSKAELNAVNQQILNRELYINNIHKEIHFLDEEITSLIDVIKAIEDDLEYLKKEYSEMIFVSYKAHNSFNKISYLFSSRSFNQLMMRLNYLEQFTEARKNQVKKINKVHDMLIKKYEKLDLSHHEKSLALLKLDKEKEQLKSLKTEKNIIVQELSQKEKQQESQLKEYRKRQKALDKLILDIIEREARKTASKTKESKLLSKNFEANKGRLPWPVIKCFISRKFGKQAHPVLKNVYVNNMGIGLQTDKSAAVRSVFNGTVTTVASIPGMGKIVMVKHGNYYTVYAKLKTVTVKSGQTITTKQNLGTVDTNSEGLTELEFQVWKEKTKLNPELWLAK